MKYNDVVKITSLISKDYSAEIFRILVNYKDISASEVASRLNLHIKTAQDFLEGLFSSSVIDRYEVTDRKKYFRYILKDKEVKININLDDCFSDRRNIKEFLDRKLRERKDSGAVFKIAGTNDYLSTISIFSGNGRNKLEWKISLTENQGRFLYNLPFPSAGPLTVQEIMDKADVTHIYRGEIFDIIDVLESNSIIDVIK